MPARARSQLIVAAAGVAAAAAVVAWVLRQRRRRRRQRPLVVGLVGPSAAGKSHLCATMERRLGGQLRVLACDDHYLKPEECPRFNLAAIPFPSGSTPQAFLCRGNADMNHPGSVDWTGVARALDKLIDECDPSDVVVVEGLLLFGEDDGAKAVLAECERVALLQADGGDKRAQDELLRRKWTRAHLGKKSYRERGVSLEDYQAYWDHYVWPSWVTHGESRCPTGAVRLDCLAPAEVNVDKLARAGCLGPAAAPLLN
mmetsp:Transcript_784/g.2032  ORF Transcript_784/g.2032 Transcript_784/m.2032 type:complete len:257 (-) Transcript_784:128-898(-)